MVKNINIIKNIKKGDTIRIVPRDMVPDAEREFKVDNILKDGFLFGLSETCDGYVMPFSWIKSLTVLNRIPQPIYNIYKAEWENITDSDEFKSLVATIITIAVEEQLPQYEINEATIVKRISKHPDDWYLYHLILKKKGKDEWAYFGSLNLTTGAINHGHYDLTYDEACRLLDEKEISLEEEDDEKYISSATAGDYSPSCPWNAPGMSVSDFV